MVRWGKTPLTDFLRRSFSKCPSFWLHGVHRIANGIFTATVKAMCRRCHKDAEGVI